MADTTPSVELNGNSVDPSDNPVLELNDGSSAAAVPVNESPATALARKHAEAHPVTMEDVVDEEDLLHPGSKSAIATGTATPIIDGPLPAAAAEAATVPKKA